MSLFSRSLLLDCGYCGKIICACIWNIVSFIIPKRGINVEIPTRGRGVRNEQRN